MNKRYVVIGGGQAGASAVARLRERDDAAQIDLVCREPVLPYQRPPLSKTFLSGEMPLERLLLHPQGWYDDNRITVHLGNACDALQTGEQKAILQDGTKLSFDAALLTVGSKARELPSHVTQGAAGFYTLRTTQDADALGKELSEGRKALIVGGGYIGLEAAAICRKSGMDVTVVEQAGRILQRVAAPQTSDYYRALHQSHGVRLLEQVGVQEFEISDGRVVGANLSTGAHLDVDVVLVGIGVSPHVELAETADLAVENGIVVDSCCKTSAEGVFAAGDCAQFPHDGGEVRLESVPHAIHHAETAATNMTGEVEHYRAAPWFWSDQYDVKLQIAGLNTGYDRVITRAGKREGAQSVWYFKGGQLLAVDAMNDAPAFMTARRIIENGKTIPIAVAEDATANLKDWV
ncbi:MAG: FAD-dependent oxidoreductase [Pseudomonadota bacterium]